MLWLLEAGLAAACFQIVAVALATAAVLLFMENDLVPEPLDFWSAAEISSNAALSLLKWTYLLTAIGTASTSNRFVDVTAEAIRNSSRVMRPTEPFHAAKTLLVQLCLAAIGFVVLILQPPPETLLGVSRHFGWGWAVLIGWPGLMSVGLAGFGASAQAAIKAL
jgi:hypothetical protein